MSKWQAYGAHLVGYLLAALPVVQAVAPAAIPGWGGVAGGVAGALLIFIHNMQTVSANKTAGTVVKAHWVVTMLAGLIALGTFVGCKTTPTATQQAAASVVVDVAAGFAIQNGSSDATVWKARAAQFKAIAVTLQQINSSGQATLATLQADLAPLIAKLGPADVLAANALVAAITPFLQQQLQANPTVANTQQAIAQVLQDVINACTAYGA